MFDQSGRERVVPHGRNFNEYRSRWDGKLDSEEIAFCRTNGIALAFDPVQQGWVLEDYSDETDIVHNTRLSDTRSTAIATLAPSYTFRPWSIEDLPVYRALLDNAAVWKYLPEEYPDPLDEDTARVLIEISNSGSHHEVCAVLQDGKIVGQARLAFPPKVRDFDVAEISYWLGELHWGKGIGTDIVRLFTERSFRTHDTLCEIYASVHSDNFSSARALEKAGYTYSDRSPRGSHLKTYRISRHVSLPASSLDGRSADKDDLGLIDG